MTAGPTLFGIVNITQDSFSDGGRYLAPEAALALARALAANGADVVDLGAAASNPNAAPVPADVEIARLAPVVAALKREGVKLSVDSFAAETQAWALAQGADYLNDIQGFREPRMYPLLAAARANLVVMHSVQGEGRAIRIEVSTAGIFERILRFFDARLDALERAGIARTRLILDPGMGLFLGSGREASFTVLRRLDELKAAFELPILVSVSRKSFLRGGRDPDLAGAPSLAAELFAVRRGADCIRTHDPGSLRDALAVWRMLDGPGPVA